MTRNYLAYRFANPLRILSSAASYDSSSLQQYPHSELYKEQSKIPIKTTKHNILLTQHPIKY